MECWDNASGAWLTGGTGGEFISQTSPERIPTSTAAPATLNCNLSAHGCMFLQVKEALFDQVVEWLCSLITQYILCVHWLPHKLWSRSDSRENRESWRKEEEIQQSHWLFTPGWWKKFQYKNIHPDLPQACFIPDPLHLEPWSVIFYFSESLIGLCECHSSPNVLTSITPLHPHYRHPRAQARARGQIQSWTWIWILGLNDQGRQVTKLAFYL